MIDILMTRFVITRLVRAIAGSAGLGNVDWSREKELATELARKSERSFEGLAVPMALFTKAPLEQRVLTTALPAGGPGSNIIPTEFGAFIDILRPNSVVYRAGATMLTGLVGNVAIPRLKASTTFAWIAENSALTAADPQLEQVTLTPKHGGSLVEYSATCCFNRARTLKTMLRNDMARNIASGIDKAAIAGTGASNQPTGILSTVGIGDVPGGTDGLAPTWGNVLALIAAVQNANGVAFGFLTTFNAVKKMRSTVRVATTDSVMIQEDPNSLAGYPLAASNNVPNNLVKGTSGATCSALIFGDWSEVLIGLWSELDVLVNPFERTAYSQRQRHDQSHDFDRCQAAPRRPPSRDERFDHRHKLWNIEPLLNSAPRAGAFLATRQSSTPRRASAPSSRQSEPARSQRI